jgi:hypothetical protein
MEIQQVEGYIFHSELVVVNCPFCGSTHRHGGGGMELGKKTHRLSHCGSVFSAALYEIQIVGTMTGKEHVAAVRRPRKTRQNPMGWRP